MAKVIDRTKTMADVYGAFYDFSLLLESKVLFTVIFYIKNPLRYVLLSLYLFGFNEVCIYQIDSKDPNAKTTFSRIQAVQKVCRDSGTIDKRYVKTPLTQYKVLETQVSLWHR